MLLQTLLSLVLAALVAIASPVPPTSLQISAPPTLKQCGVATFTWTRTSAPYYFSILHSASGSTTGFTKDVDTAIIPKRPTASWIVDYPAGTTVRIFIRDSEGSVTGTLPMVIEPGSSDCLDDGEEDEVVVAPLLRVDQGDRHGL